MKTLLVIGGSGFFGKSILDAFSRDLLAPWRIGKVIVMSRNANRLLQDTPDLVGQNVELYSADITNTERLPFADYVIHAAASTDVRNYLSSPEDEKKNIQAGTNHFCDLAKIHYTNSKIVYVSSGAIYGVQPPNLDAFDESFVGDLSRMAPGKLDYAVAKQDAERAIIDLGCMGLNVSIARCFAFVGKYLPRDQHFAIGNFIDDVINKRPIAVKANHQVYRSYMYADDLVEWLMTIADHAAPNCPIYNVGSDQAILLSDLARDISESYRLAASIPLISDAIIDRYIPSIKKAQDELGLILSQNLKESVEKTLIEIKQDINYG
ncbi:MAG: NAD(P)-dependent oxidoreductase [Sulfuritalea sp.]|nr:NAD(P)-dependent oxidoreductase [Sulfuritalea sp.]